jgi:hypothetical protein
MKESGKDKRERQEQYSPGQPRDPIRSICPIEKREEEFFLSKKIRDYGYFRVCRMFQRAFTKHDTA